MSSHSPKVLLIMRHAKSSWKEGDLDDHERPLNRRGQLAACQMARYLISIGHRPERILASSATRAIETARIAASEFEQKRIEILPELYHAMPGTLTQILSSLSSDRTTLILGHNPGMEEFISDLNGEVISFPTAAVACLQVNNGSETFQPDHLALTAIWRPRELPKSIEEIPPTA